MRPEDMPKTEIWQLYEIGKNYNERMHVYSDTDRNYRMYNGNQWYGLPRPPKKGIEPIQLNIIKKIVRHKVGNINSNNYLPVFRAENFDNNEFHEVAVKTCDLLSKLASKVWEKDNMDYKTRAISKHSAINDECPVYITYNAEINMPEHEILSKNDIYYGNENDSDIQNQPYILIKQRKPVLNLIEMAKAEGVSEDMLQYIIADNNTENEAGDSAKEEVDDKCTLITKLYKKDGKVHFSQATKLYTIKEDRNTGLTLYPVEHMLWEEKEGSARGEGEVRHIIPNQLEINKTEMRRLIAAKLNAYQQKVVDISKITNPNAIDQVGATIKVNGMGIDDVKKAIGTITPSQMSPDAEKVMNELITITRDLAGAGDVAAGDIRPDIASGKAILAVQQANQMPLTEQTLSLKKTLEGIARIWLDMWKTYASDGLIINYEEVNPLTGEEVLKPVKVPYTVLQELQANVKIDITPKSPYDKFAQELSMENLLKAGYFKPENIDELESYIDALDDDCAMPKIGIKKVIKSTREKKKRISEIQMQAQKLQIQADKFLGTQSDIASIGQYGNNLINQVMPS